MSGEDIFISVVGADAGRDYGTECIRPASSYLPDEPSRDTREVIKDLCRRDGATALGVMQDRILMRFAARTGRPGQFVTPRQIRDANFGWDSRALQRMLGSAEILLPDLVPTHPPDAPEIDMTNRELFLHGCGEQALKALERSVNQNAPHLSKVVEQVLDAHQRLPGVCFLMRADAFRGFAELLDTVMDGMTQHGAAPRRQEVDEMSVLLLSAYAEHGRATGQYRVAHLDTVHRLLPPAATNPDRVRTAIKSRLATAPRAASRGDNSGPMPVVLAFDRNYAPHAAVTMKSALEAAARPERIAFHVLQSGDIDADTESKLAGMVAASGASLSFHDVDASEFADFPLNRAYISIAAYYRLVMHRILPPGLERAVYLDSDTVVVEDLEKLFSQDLAGLAIGACPDEGGLRQSRRLALSSRHRYFNSGILLLDLNLIRSLDFEPKVQRAFDDYGPLITLQDQDLLNLVFCGSTRELPLRWNANTRLYVPNELEPAYTDREAREAAENPAVLHFTDRRKPWHRNCLHPLADLYWDVRSRTPWSESFSERAKRKFHRGVRHLASRSQRNLDRLFAELRES